MQKGIEAGNAFDPRARNAELRADITDRGRAKVTVQFLHLAQYLQQSVRVAAVAIQYRIVICHVYLAICLHEALPNVRHAATLQAGIRCNTTRPEMSCEIPPVLLSRPILCQACDTPQRADANQDASAAVPAFSQCAVCCAGCPADGSPAWRRARHQAHGGAEKSCATPSRRGESAAGWQNGGRKAADRPPECHPLRQPA